MASGSGFYTGSAGEWSSAVGSFDIEVGVKSFATWEKFTGATNDIPNTVDGPAVRQKVVSVTVATTGTTYAHGLEDSAGNPVTPTNVIQLAAPAAGDLVSSYQAPDATNIYLAASVAGEYTLAIQY